MQLNLRRDTWCCGILAIAALDRLLKIAAHRGASLELGLLSYSDIAAADFLADISMRDRPFMIVPPIMFIFWAMWKFGGLKPRPWSMFFVAGMAAVAFDVLMTQGVQYCFTLALSGGAVVFSLGTLSMFLGLIVGICEMVIESSR